MYHILCNLETRFNSLAEAEQYIAAKPVFQPEIPHTAMPFEDCTVPRICLAPTIEACITAIGVLGMFRRCANTSPDTKSYENDNEVYPVIACEFPDEIPENPYITPDKTQVPDINLTNEKWLLHPAAPTSMQLYWLNQYSLDIDTDKEQTLCTRVRFVTDLTGQHHPWLDQTGHPLDCSDLGSDRWPDNTTQNIFAASALKFLYKEQGGAGEYVYPVPLSNCRVTCHVVKHGDNGLVLTGETYTAFSSRLNAYTGFRDKNGMLIFENDMVYLCGDNGVNEIGIVLNENGASRLRLFRKPEKSALLHELTDRWHSNLLPNVKLVSPDGRKPVVTSQYGA